MEALGTISNVLLTPLHHFTEPWNKTFYLYLTTSLAVAIFIHYREATQGGEKRGALAYMLPQAVYTHPSAVVDYIYFISNTILYAVLLVPFAGFGGFVSNTITTALGAVFTPHVLTELSGITITIIFSIVVTLLADFGSFLAHYYLHRIPVLWEFHKVHHSAEVLTPITVYRMHPLDDIITLLVIGILTGTVDALTRFFIAPGVSTYAIGGLSVALFLFFVGGYHLRHSHIWLSYGPMLSKILISPAQHQIHHSKARRHWNKNYGFIFAIWDYLFGSLYVPKERETIEFGIGNDEEREYSSPLRLYFLPFKKALKVMLRR